MLHAMSVQLPPFSSSTSTRQIRQLPGTERRGCQQKYGIEMPFATAACSTVSFFSARTGFPSMKSSSMAGNLEAAVAPRPLVHDPVVELVAELLQNGDRGIAGGVPHPADRRAVVGARDRLHALDVLGHALARDDAVDDPMEPPHAVATGGALAAGFVMVEAQHHLQQAHHARALGDDDHPAGAERRAG